MKTSMKLMVMTLVVAMLLSMSAFAASVSYTSLVPTEDGTDYSVTVNYAAADYATGDQVTLLVLKDSAEITWADDAQTVPANVIYIDQETIEGATGSFTFAIAKTEVDNSEVYVKLGATSQAKAAEGTYEDFVGGGESTGDVVLDSTNAQVGTPVKGTKLGESVGLVYTVAITDATLEGKVPQAYVGDTAVGTVLYSAERQKYIVVIPAANAEDTITIKAVDAANAIVTEFVYGDINGNGKTDATDVQFAKLYFKELANNLNTVAKIIASDVSGDGKINGTDVQFMKMKFKTLLEQYNIITQAIK